MWSRSGHEDAATAEGRLLHERADAGGAERRPGIRVARNLALRSFALGSVAGPGGPFRSARWLRGRSAPSERIAARVRVAFLQGANRVNGWTARLLRPMDIRYIVGTGKSGSDHLALGDPRAICLATWQMFWWQPENLPRPSVAHHRSTALHATARTVQKRMRQFEAADLMSREERRTTKNGRRDERSTGSIGLIRAATPLAVKTLRLIERCHQGQDGAARSPAAEARFVKNDGGGA